jgi:peptide/nickel transport system permease protein
MLEPTIEPTAAAEALPREPQARWQTARAAGLGLAGRLIQDAPLALASAILLVLVVLAILGPFFLPKATALNLAASLESPSPAHPMGTDSLGRDVFARFCVGARISLYVASIVVLVGTLLGGGVGVLGGAVGGWLDNVFMRVMDALLAFPPLILAMAVTVALGPGLFSATIGITIPAIPWYARLLRSDVLKIHALPFIEATVGLGASSRRRLLRHVVPHMLSTLFNQSAAIFSYAILSLAALSFVGLGAQEPTPEWGKMITEGEQYALTGQWWLAVFAGLGLLAVTTAVSIIADRTRDILDPRGQR